jgi:hypothetical protein
VDRYRYFPPLLLGLTDTVLPPFVTSTGQSEMHRYSCPDLCISYADTKNVDDLRVPQAMPQEAAFDDKYARLIDWNVDVLLHHSARVISCRSRSPAWGSLVNHSSEVALLPSAVNEWHCRPLTRMPLDFEGFAQMFPCCNRLEQICMSTSRE